MSEKTTRTTWAGCYNGGWQGVIVPEAFSHPAKFARGLIKRIYEHAFERAWLEEDSIVLDPFGGIALGAWPAMRMGLTWLGIELEPRFVLLGQGGDCDGIVKTERGLITIEAEPGYKGWFVRLRPEAKYWGKSGVVCHSIPRGEGFDTPSDAWRFVYELTVIDSMWPETSYKVHHYEKKPVPERQEWQDVVIESAICGKKETHEPHHVTGNIESWNARYSRMPHWGTAQLLQGDSRRLSEVVREAGICISSPPWESVEVCQDKAFWLNDGRKVPPQGQAGYGNSDGQLGQGPPATFWQAARTIVQQVHQVLKPGGVAIWVLKAFVRNKAIVDFPGQWQRMAEACGFETVEIVHALLTEDRGAQYALDGELHEKSVGRKSFFRRLHEYHASAKMYWEQHVTSRNARTTYIWRVKPILWAKRRYDLAEGKENIAPVTRNRIVTAAKVLAYEEAGKPWMDIDTRIDYEVVLCQRKPLETGKDTWESLGRGFIEHEPDQTYGACE